MKLLVILALALVTMGQDPPIKYYEPEDLDCCCAGCGDPSLVSFDYALLMIFDTQKSVISAWGQFVEPNGYLDTCKFGFRIVTKNDFPEGSGKVYYDWLGFGWGMRNVEGKNFRNFLLGQDTNGEAISAVRGQDFKKPKVLANNPAVQKQKQKNGDICYWKVHEVNPHLVTLRSSCCPYALNWRPNGEESCWEFFVDSKKYSGQGLTGMCGDCNRDNYNDFRECPEGPQLDPFDTDTLKEISDSCADGKHQGWAFPAGSRL